MLIIYAFVFAYIITFFTIMALVGIGYLATFFVRRVRSRTMLVPEGPTPKSARPIYLEDFLKAA
jgi:hypothetical protein